MAAKSENLSENYGRRRAVVDIGSNSVRLVVYEGPARAPVAICNEKALCGLGRDMTDDGRLAPAAVEDALATLGRFERLLREYDSPPVNVIATAAVREAKDGKAFVKSVKALGFDVSILTGAEEASMAAMGVVSYEPGATGIVGDMGGGSLELVSVKKGAVKETASLSIGPLSIMSKVGDDDSAALALINKSLDDVDWLKSKSLKTLFAVGGAWRAVARIHMRLRSYPLSVIHRYELGSREVIEICDLVSRQSRRSLEEIPGISRRRLDTLPLAAVVMKQVIECARIDKVSFSAGGVREGVLYNDLNKDERRIDPLTTAARFYAEKLSPEPSFGDAASSVLAPLFKEDNDYEERLRHVACLLTDVGAYFHPDHRGRHAFDTALRAPFVSIGHHDKVLLALTLYRRYNGRNENLPNEQAVGLLSWDEQQRALRIGLALRFVASLAPKVGASIRDCVLFLEKGRLIFQAPRDREALMGDTPTKRLSALAAAFESEPATLFED